MSNVQYLTIMDQMCATHPYVKMKSIFIWYEAKSRSFIILRIWSTRKKMQVGEPLWRTRWVINLLQIRPPSPLIALDVVSWGQACVEEKPPSHWNGDQSWSELSVEAALRSGPSLPLCVNLEIYLPIDLSLQQATIGRLPHQCKKFLTGFRQV